MQDFIYIVILSSLMWLSQVSKEYEDVMQQQLAQYDENMAVLWVEAESTTQRLKQCEKRKKR